MVGFAVGAVVGWIARSAASGTPPAPPADVGGDGGAGQALEDARTALREAVERAEAAEQALAAAGESSAHEAEDAGDREQLQLKHDVLAQRVREAEAALEVCQARCNKFRQRADVSDALDKQLKTALARIAALEAQQESANELPEEPTGPTAGSSEPDDLRSIAGVGPKIERLLRANGIETFAQLGASTPDAIRSYLVQGGAHMAKYDPEPWIAEAAERSGG